MAALTEDDFALARCAEVRWVARDYL
eukprot:SAG25_NODE_6202_length_579_cov_1.079167_1_plen_26_part_10